MTLYVTGFSRWTEDFDVRLEHERGALCKVAKSWPSTLNEQQLALVVSIQDQTVSSTEDKVATFK